jgi:hypothetical protein
MTARNLNINKLKTTETNRYISCYGARLQCRNLGPIPNQGRIIGFVGPSHFSSLGRFRDSKSIVGTTVHSRLSGLMEKGEGCTMGIGGPFQGVKRGRGVTLTTHPHLVPRSRMSRSYISSPPKRLRGMQWNSLALAFYYYPPV